MATHDSSAGPGASIHDQRTPPRGVLPRQIQMWLMAGLAVIILTIILFTGRTTPTPPPSVAARTQPSLMAPDRIQTYQRQLANDETRLRAELAQQAGPARAGVPPAATGIGDTPTPDPIVAEQRRREYQSLFADNVALSHRPTDASSYAEHTSPTGSSNPPSSAVMSPQELLLLRALASQRTPVVAPSTPAPTTAVPASDRSATSDGQPSVSQGPTPPSPPKETGPIRSDDARQRVSEGTVIETVLINRLDGSLVGPVDCLVTTPIYSHDRQEILIPAGARILGAAAPVQMWGDSRLAVSFHRLVMPDGRSYSLDQFKGLDQIGETGLKDEVNRHYLQVFGASAAIGALSGLAQYSTVGGFGTVGFEDQYRQTAGASLAASTGRVLDRYLNVLPTITIREGYRIKVYLTNDLELPAVTPDNPGGAQ